MKYDKFIHENIILVFKFNKVDNFANKIEKKANSLSKFKTFEVFK